MKTLILLCALCGLVLSACGPNADEKALQAFIDEHVKTIEPKLKARNLASWNANATGERKFYDENAALDLDVRKTYAKAEEFGRLKAWKESGRIGHPLLKRQLTVLFNSYLPNQIDTALMAAIVAKETRIAEMFNTFRAKARGRALSDNEIDTVLRTETDPGKRREAWEASKQVGQAVAPMVLELVALRNQAARGLGFEDYYAMSLAMSEQDGKEVLSVFDELKRLTDEPFRALKAGIDSALAKQWGIAPEHMQPWHYTDRFFQEAQAIGEVDLERYFKGKPLVEIAQGYFRGVGLPVEGILKRSDLYGRPGKYQHAFCTDIDRLGDIRVICSLMDSHYWMAALMHELGHAVYAENIDPGLPFLLRDAAHAFTTEAVAQLFERQTSNTDWLVDVMGADPKDKQAIAAAVRRHIAMRQLCFSRWSQVMIRFERAMYQDPTQDLNALWWNLVEENQFVKRPAHRNRPDWAAKIHLAQYPAYYHNYELGELAASQILDAMNRKFLKRKTLTDISFAFKPAVGTYLKEKIFAPGMRLHWNDLLKDATGETLTPKYFVNQFVEQP